ncbi:MAG TPA: hypothetical protein VLS25_06670 [Dehalococcoidia bacterium]|nr:hypothetical protein [Dehalococcoidia bacterium]
MRGLILTILSLFWAVVLVLTGGRFLALLANANHDSRIVQRLYDWSDFWVQPFFRMFGLENKAVSDTGGVFEPASLIAFVVYLLVGALVLNLITGAAFTRWGRA